jgi:DNA-binding transcriptional ArsR family regulator
MPIQSENLSDQNIDTAGQLVFLEPVYNLLHSLVLLNKEDHLPGLADWILRTKDNMSLEERQRHHLVINGLFYSFTPHASWQSFAGYVDHLASLRPEVFQDRLLSMYYRCSREEFDLSNPNPVYVPSKEEILASTDRYLAFLEERFDPSGLDLDLEAQAYRYVINPPAMQALVVDHLRYMWDKYLSSEWARIRPMLRKAVNAFKQIDLSAKSRLEAVQFVINRELPNQCWEKMIENAERVVLVPNAHIGPYLGKFIYQANLFIIFGARLPEGAQTEVPDLTRTEILSRLGTLADNNRLRILRLVADAGELRTSTVMESLDLGQSAASRHLTQLTATGYLLERRCESGKCYTLNSERIEDTLRALARFLSVSPRIEPGTVGE